MGDMRVTRKMFADEEVEEAIWRCISESLELTETTAMECFLIESIRSQTEVKSSGGFPGLLTHYHQHLARVRMLTRCLPTCTEFFTSVDGPMRSGGKHLWTWCTRQEFERKFPESAPVPTMCSRPRLVT